MGYLDDKGLTHLWGKIDSRLASKQDRLTGAAGQVVGFDAHGEPLAQEPSAVQVGFFPGDTGMSSQNVQKAIEELFTSVGDGKAAVASAVTDKGVPTAQDATFAQIAENILALPSGGAPEGTYSVGLRASDPEGGTVSGGGLASEGMTVTVQATTGEDYLFRGWTEDGETVTPEEQYTFLVDRDRTLVAEFFKPEYMLGRDWWSTSMPASMAWQAICYGDGKFVAVGDSDIAAYSEDGVNWTPVTLPYNGAWRSVAYGDGKFIAISPGNSLAAYSTDGITWTTVQLPFARTPGVIAYGDGKWVVLGNACDLAAYSEDGITWERTTLPLTVSYSLVAYANGKFVATCFGYTEKSVVLCSEDGITWEKTTLPIFGTQVAVTFGKGRFVAVGYNCDQLAFSTDGSTWETIPLPVQAKWYGIAYGDGKFVAIIHNSAIAYYSSDLITWTAADMPSTAASKAIAYGAGTFVVTANGTKDTVVYSRSSGPGIYYSCVKTQE